MSYDNDLNRYFRSFLKGYEIEKTNPGLLDKLMSGMTIKRISTHGLRDGVNYRKKIESLQSLIQKNQHDEL